MSYYRISVPVTASAAIYVEANSPEEALEKAQDHVGMSINICWHCGNHIDDPSVGEADSLDQVDEVTDDEDLEKAQEWIEENS